MQPAMSGAQRRFRFRGARRPGEDEPQVARPVGRRRDDLAGLRRNRHSGDARDRLRGGQALDSMVNAAPWNRDHHDSRGAALAGNGERFRHHLAQNQLLQAHAQGMGEHPTVMNVHLIVAAPRRVPGPRQARPETRVAPVRG